MAEPVPDLSRTELVIGLVGAIGTDLPFVAKRCGSLLTDIFAYEVSQIGVSDLLRTIEWDDGRDLSPEQEDLRLRARMDAGRDLCQGWKAHDALAQLAMLRISQIRDDTNGDQSGKPLDRHAFILRSLKRPAEIERLRAVYGSRFVVIGAYSPRRNRREYLVEKLEESYGTRDERKYALSIDRDLIERDEKESGEGGQNVRGTFHQADFFVETHTGRLDEQLERSLRVLFGDPLMTPTKDEAGMAQADRAARRSAEPGRQVGAAIVNSEGDLLAVGCNEVPRAFGGQYWMDDADVIADPHNDGREMRRDEDTNNVVQSEIASDVLGRLRDFLKADAADDPEALTTAILGSRLGDITEFGRAVHAEMAAITTAARLGVGLNGATVLTDTFPCHNCARHIITTGIRRVVYIAPYAKSQAHKLHEDAIVVAPAEPPEKRSTGKVVFEPFIGVAPRRFDELFAGIKRKDEDGTIIVRDFSPPVAEPRLGASTKRAGELEVVAYRAREDFDLTALRKRLPDLHPRSKERAT
ncbi:MAG TPA: anti-phage dCTP deaminase [Solirubrobacteraceae bacterium]|nr:anti-phage dCTP deaminase [Solirubrobacteraceae bacterium]